MFDRSSKSMPVRLDPRGVPIITEVTEAAHALEHAAIGLLGHRADTAQHLQRALELDPSLVPARCMAAFAYKALGRRDLDPSARAQLELARSSLLQRGGSPREQGLVAALEAWCADRPLAAARGFAQVLRAYPRDALAFKFCHALNFILGRPRAMRASIERALPAWDEATAGYGYVLGCHAFALEETGELARAEAVGRRAVALEPRDAWGAHAVAHVLESQDRPRDGLRWMDAVEPALAGCNNFGGHLAWHRSLLCLQLGDFDQALALHDERIAVHLGRDYRDLANASTLLWRLQCEGIDVGTRFQRLAELARERSGDHGLAFADAHHVLALCGAGELEQASRFVASMQAAASERSGLYARVAGEVGVPLAHAIVALAAGNPGAAVARLQPVAASLLRLGGSNAQRDIFAQLLIEAALRSDDVALASALLDQRLTSRPRNRYAAVRRSRLHARTLFRTAA